MATRITILLITAMAVVGIAKATPSGTLNNETISNVQVIPPVSMDPRIRVEDATAAQLDRLSLALSRYADASLALPDLHVELHGDPEPCGGANGLFRTDSVPWRILICTDDLGIVYEHELAHAWERSNISIDLRNEFMNVNGYEVWRSHDVAPHERAVEGIAVSIQRGVSGLPLPPALGRPTIERLRTYELLTGRPDPRLIVWLQAHEIDCAERPTALSTVIPDARALVCGGEMAG